MPEKNEIVIYITPDGKETFKISLKRHCLDFSKADGRII